MESALLQLLASFIGELQQRPFIGRVVDDDEIQFRLRQNLKRLPGIIFADLINGTPSGNITERYGSTMAPLVGVTNDL